ncbi:tryptophan dimethylallyltransferase-domain-containing protein [Mycena galericulata]|nr:tryptophan dimethylallyltransferase-domain-containing protein [Mycena galericulata]
MRQANYPQDAVHAYTSGIYLPTYLPSLLLNEVLPLLGPTGNPAYPSWMTDDHTPVEFSLVLGKTTKSSVRFAFEPSILPLAGERSVRPLRHTLERLASGFPMAPKFDLDWFDICAEALLLSDMQERNRQKDHPVSEVFIGKPQLWRPFSSYQLSSGFDCAHYSATMKVYFMPRIRCLPWAKISEFLSRFLPGDRPEIEIVAIDCVPGSQNRLKIYFRTDLMSDSHMEYFLTLGGTLSAADLSGGLHNAKLAWNAITRGSGDGLPTQSTYFPSSAIYYELKQGDDYPSSKVYLPVRRYLRNDMDMSRSIESLSRQLSDPSVTNTYPDFLQTVFPHRPLSTRTGVHTYVGCTAKPGGGDISLYYSPEAFAPERHTNSRRLIGT